MMNMTPYGPYGLQQPQQPQNPYLSLSQAVAPRPAPQVPYYQPPVSPFLPSMPAPAPYVPQTLASPPETDTRSGLRRTWDQGMYNLSQPQEGFDLLNPPTPEPQYVPLPPRPGGMDELTPVDQRQQGPNYWPTQPAPAYDSTASGSRRPLPYDAERAEPGTSRQGILDYLKGLNEGDWLGEKSLAPDLPSEPVLPEGYGGRSLEERDEARRRAREEAAPGGGSSTDAVVAAYGGGGGSIPGLPARKGYGEMEIPDLGDYPDAPTYVSPDFTKANSYLEAARPTAPEASQKEIGMAMLMGAARGFSPYGSVGEILGRMAAPGAEAGFAEHKEDEALKRQYESDLASWNSAMGTQAGSQATTEANVKNQNVQAQYENAASKYQDAWDKFKFGDERQRWEAQHELAVYGAELERIKVGIAQQGLQARLAYYQKGGANGGQMTYSAVQDAISDATKFGWIPGKIDLQAVRAGALQEMLNDPNWGPTARQLSPDAFAAEMQQRVNDSVTRTVMADPQMMQEVYMFNSKPKGEGNMMDFIGALNTE